MINKFVTTVFISLCLLAPMRAWAEKPAKNTRKQAQKSAPPKKIAKKSKSPDKDVSENKNGLPTNLLGGDFGQGPTYIKADALTLKPKDRIFLYDGGVEVKHKDMILSCASLQGEYDENNQIKTLTAEKDVLITKGAGIKAHGNKAVYDGKTSILTLTDNPELEQNGSVLTADKIKIFMKENRSEAEGAVRMKMVQNPGASASDLLNMR